MSNGPWTDEENDLIVADYFAMLADDVSGHTYNKAEHRRGLLPLLNDRSEGSVEFKHQNISAVLKGLGEDWIPGYKPAFNFQMALVDAVARWLALNPAWLDRHTGAGAPTGLAEARPIWIGPPPTLSNQPPPQELEQMLHIACKFDVAARDERNRALGRAGEERVLAHERAALKSAGRDDLARKVRWVSEEDGDGAGYDIVDVGPVAHLCTVAPNFVRVFAQKCPRDQCHHCVVFFSPGPVYGEVTEDDCVNTVIAVIQTA